MSQQRKTFRAIEVGDGSDGRWATHTQALWPLAEGWMTEESRTSEGLDRARNLFEAHMPELVPVLDRLAGRAVASVGGSNATISGSTISDNTVDWGGGGLYGGGLTVRSTTVSGNKAHHAGGVHSLGTLLMQSSTVRNNSAEMAGGVYNAGTGTITGSRVRDNTAGTGGGVFNLTGSLTIDYSTINGNTATVEGGGLHNYDGTLDVNSSILWGNKVTAAGSRGGALYNWTGTATLTRSFVVGNRAVLEGGGIFETPGGTVNLVDSFVFANTPDNCRPAGTVPGCTG